MAVLSSTQRRWQHDSHGRKHCDPVLSWVNSQLCLLLAGKLLGTSKERKSTSFSGQFSLPMPARQQLASFHLIPTPPHHEGTWCDTQCCSFWGRRAKTEKIFLETCCQQRHNAGPLSPPDTWQVLCSKKPSPELDRSCLLVCTALEHCTKWRVNKPVLSLSF